MHQFLNLSVHSRTRILSALKDLQILHLCLTLSHLTSDQSNSVTLSRKRQTSLCWHAVRLHQKDGTKWMLTQRHRCSRHCWAVSIKPNYWPKHIFKQNLEKYTICTKAAVEKVPRRINKVNHFGNRQIALRCFIGVK